MHGDAIYFISASSVQRPNASKKAGLLQAAIYLDDEYDPADNKDLLNIRADRLSRPLQETRRHKSLSTTK